MLPLTPESRLQARRHELDIFRNHPVSGHLVGLFDRYGHHFRVERSFKIKQGCLLQNRFIITVPLYHPEVNIAPDIPGICRSLQMPELLQLQLEARLADAVKVHWGVEQDLDRTLLKAYLEFPGDTTLDNRQPWQLLQGFKWDADHPEHYAVSRYTGLPSYRPAEIIEKVGTLLTDEKSAPLKQIIDTILGVCDRRSPDFRMWYLDVTEPGNPRCSFDFKTYRARLSIGDIEPLLSQLCGFFDVPYRTWEPYFVSLRKHKFGHLSCGTGRDGKLFVALYHEAKGQ